MILLRIWQRLNLWPRLAISATLGYLVVFGVFSVLSLRAVNESTDRILEERLVISQMAANEIGRLVGRGFAELEAASAFTPFDPSSPSLTEEHDVLAHAYGRAGALSLGVYFLDPAGTIVGAEPRDLAPIGTDFFLSAEMPLLAGNTGRRVSEPFIDPVTGRPAVALSMPVLNDDGTVRSVLAGLIDITGPEVSGALSQAKELGHTGHAELVDGMARIIVSTDYGAFMEPGEHLEFYKRMLGRGGSAVETVPYLPLHPPEDGGEFQDHVMAFSAVPGAPWGVAIGGDESETFATATRLRDTILVAGSLVLAMLWAITLVGARLLVRPVRTLTEASRLMASGNLERPVRVSEGGEIRDLAESLETMREQLRASMARIQTWGNDLEQQVHERTAELAASNRQFRAISAVATAANEALDMQGMLDRCLDVTLRETAMDAGTVRTFDPDSGLLIVASMRGDPSLFACRDRAVGPGECPCGQVVQEETPLFFSDDERRNYFLPCAAPDGVAMAVMPLKTASGMKGVIHLSRKNGAKPSKEERETLRAITGPLATAIENANLAKELGRIVTQREMDRVKTEFISALSHELRTPLGIIKGYATTLLRDDISVDAATRREFTEIIVDETETLQRMIDDLLDGSRIEAGRFALDRTSVVLQELLETTIDRVLTDLHHRGFEVKVDIAVDGSRAAADPVRIQQVVRNLVDNAAQYSDPGTVIEIKGRVRDGLATVSVRDHGDGIPEHELDWIFETFHRGENSRKRRAPGTGLGLAICRTIVESHGGKLTVESKLGDGSTFTFTLPLERPDRVPGNGPLPARDQPAGPP